MSRREIKNEVKQEVAISPVAVKTTSTNGNEADMQGHDSLLAVLNFGVCADGTYTPKFEESDTSGSGYSDVAAEDLEGSFTAITSANDVSSQRVAYKGNKRYVRLVITASGSPSTGGFYSAMYIKAHGHAKPVA